MSTEIYSITLHWLLLVVFLFLTLTIIIHDLKEFKCHSQRHRTFMTWKKSVLSLYKMLIFLPNNFIQKRHKTLTDILPKYN